MTTGQQLDPRAIQPSNNNAETLATVDDALVYVEGSVPVILLPAGSTAVDVPAGTPVGTIILVKA
jgi:hypothetical protein